MATSILLSSSGCPKFMFSTPKLNRLVTPINSYSNRGFLKGTRLLHSNGLMKHQRVFVLQDASDTSVSEDVVVGEDSASFDMAKQKITSWIHYVGVMGVVFCILDVTWLNKSTGFGKVFIDTVSSVSNRPEVVMFLLTLIFAIVHSGLACLRDYGEKLIGERAFHWIFALMSFPLATSTILVGMMMWCIAHAVWIGNSVAVAASVGLIGHHLFGVWNGDRRLKLRYGEAFDIMKSRTSVIPFAAILDGRQKLPKDYYKEFIRLPYLAITGLPIGAYFAHPLMQAASFRLHW